MDSWLIVLIIVLAILGAILLTLFTAYLLYRIAFYSKRSEKNDLYLKKVLKAYGAYGEKSEVIINHLKSHEYERVYITSHDGLVLSARYYHKADGAPLHILFHGYRSLAELDMSGGAYECMALSHNVLLVDQRAHGESEGKTISFGINERRDLLLWCDYAKERFGEKTKIFIWGLSMGAATVLMSLDLPLPENVIAAIADCPYSSPEAIIRRVGRKIHMPVFLLFPFLRLGARIFGGFKLGEISAEKSVLSSKIPVLLIHGEADTYVPCEMSEKMANAAMECGVDLRFVKFANAPHGMSYLEDSEKYRTVALEFINEMLERKE